MDISRHYDEISHCNKCGFCQVACPIFRSTGHESGVARGRLALIRAIIEKRMDWTREIEEPLYDCLLCGACTSNCFPAIPTSDLLIEARAEYLEKVGRKSIHRLLFDHLLPHPRRLHLAARAVALGKDTGLPKLARALGLLRFLGHDFFKADEIIERFPRLPFRDRFKPGVYKGSGKALRIGYFVGCGMDIIQHSAAEATLKLLKQMGKTVHILDNCCCGLPAWTFGDVTVAEKLAEKNLHTLLSSDVDVIVTDCSSCASFLKKYPRLFHTKLTSNEKAEALFLKIRDMVELLFTTNFVRTSSSPVVPVTYHDPCHASRGQGLTTAPRDVLRRMPGLEFIELPEADWCCGGAGAYALSHFDLSSRVLDRKMENIKKTGAWKVVTSCPACMVHLSYGLRKKGLDAQVCHISEVVEIE